MLVVEKTRRIEVRVTGEGEEIIASLIKESLPEAFITQEEDESVIWKDTDTAKGIKAGKTPGKLLRAYRERAGMCIVDFARAVGTKYPNISAMENDRRGIGLAMAKKIGKILNVDFKIFLMT